MSGVNHAFGKSGYSHNFFVLTCLFVSLGIGCDLLAVENDNKNMLTLSVSEAVSSVSESGYIEKPGNMPTNDTSDVTHIVVHFMQKAGSSIIPLKLHSISIMPEWFANPGTSSDIGLDTIRNGRRHETLGSFGIGGDGHRDGGIGIRFNVVQANYSGSGYATLEAGNKYRIRCFEPLFAEAWIHVPKDIDFNKQYEARWLVEPPENKETDQQSKPQPPLLQCTVRPSFLSGITGMTSAFYQEVGTDIERESVLGSAGKYSDKFTFQGSLDRGCITLYTAQNKSVVVALCSVSGTSKERIVIPDDATEIYDRSKFVSGKICVDKDLLVTRESLLVALYPSSSSQIPLCFYYTSDKQYLSDVSRIKSGQNAVIMSFAFLPGDYDVRFYQFGGRSNDETIFNRESLSRSKAELLAQVPVHLSESVESNSFLLRPLSVDGGRLPGKDQE